MRSVLEKINKFCVTETKLSNRLFILFIFLYLFIFIFQGLDFADEGLYVAIYQQIFHSPESIQYYFNYWLTAVIGGLWLKVFPFLGLFGVRIAGILVVTATIALVYNALKEHISVRSLRLGVLIGVIILSCRTPFELDYDNLSVFFWTGGSVLLYNGLRKRNLAIIFLSGAVVGFNVFIRIPNILGLAILTAVFFYGWLEGFSLRKQVRDALYFLIGFAVAIVIMIMLMVLMGHFKIFISSIYTTMEMGSSPEDPHNLKDMIYILVNQYYLVISYASVFVILFIIYIVLSKLIFPSSKSDLFNKLFLFLVILVSIFFTINGGFKWVQLEFLVIGISLFSNILILVRKGTHTEIKTLSYIGLLLLFVFPVGCAGALDTAGRSALWISLAFAVEFILDLIPLKVSYVGEDTKKEQFVFSERHIKLFTDLFIYLCILTGLLFAFSSPYFDRSSRVKMFSSVHHKYLKGIFTTPERARAIDELLLTSSVYIKPDDFVLAYADIPMFYYLTETRSYLGNPWPGMFTSDMLKNSLNKSEESKHQLPFVVMQKVKMLNTNWPENDDIPYMTIKDNDRRNEHINKFLDKFEYQVVWENRAFAIMKPGKKEIDDFKKSSK